jgi:hypothetical protein
LKSKGWIVSTKPVKAKFEFKESTGRINENKEISWQNLPRGKYFFHCTSVQRLASIKKIGLVPPASHASKRYWDELLSNARKDRLFFFTKEEDCFFWLKCMNYRHPRKKLIVVRFKRSLIADSKLFSDPLLDPEYEISFSANCRVSPNHLEACIHATQDDKCLRWVPIAKTGVVTRTWTGRPE